MANADTVANREAMLELVSQLRQKLNAVQQGGGAEALRRDTGRGKMFVRERIATLLDPDTPFLEFSALAANGMYKDEAPGAGIVTGMGTIQGHRAIIVANDATIKGGTYYPITVKKHLRAQEIALENHLPCVYLVDSGGAFLPLQAEVFPDREHFGRIFHNQAIMSSRGICQVAAVMGSCTAGGADVHCRISGVADHCAENDADALRIIREIFKSLPSSDTTSPAVEDPKHAPDEIYGVVARDPRRVYDIRRAIPCIADGSWFQEFKALHAGRIDHSHPTVLKISATKVAATCAPTGSILS